MAVEKQKRYTCWGCHTPGFKEEELVGHRCSSCRDKRRLAAEHGGRFSPYTVEGAAVWKASEVGSRAGFVWQRRKKRLGPAGARKALERTERRVQAREKPE